MKFWSTKECTKSSQIILKSTKVSTNKKVLKSNKMVQTKFSRRSQKCINICTEEGKVVY